MHVASEIRATRPYGADGGAGSDSRALRRGQTWRQMQERGEVGSSRENNVEPEEGSEQRLAPWSQRSAV